MLFEDGIGFSGWMATHPPLLARIQALRPGFKPAAFEQALARQQLPAPSGLDEDHAKALAAAPPPLPPEQTAVRVSPPAVAEGLGAWQPTDIERARAIIEAIPQVLDRAARDRDEAMPLLFGLLFSTEAAVQQKQRIELKARMGEAMVNQTADYAERVQGLHAALRLPLAMLAAATLKRRARSDVEAVADVCTSLAPPQRMTSRDAASANAPAAVVYRTPLARRPSNSTLRAIAPVMIFRFARLPRMGSRYAVADEQREPLRVVVW